MRVTCTCPKCGGTMIAGTMTRHDVVLGFWLCFKCGLMEVKGVTNEELEELVWK